MQRIHEDENVDRGGEQEEVNKDSHSLVVLLDYVEDFPFKLWVRSRLFEVDFVEKVEQINDQQNDHRHEDEPERLNFRRIFLENDDFHFYMPHHEPFHSQF